MKPVRQQYNLSVCISILLLSTMRIFLEIINANSYAPVNHYSVFYWTFETHSVHSYVFYTGALKLGTDESVFTSVLVRNSYAQLQAVSDAYQELAGKTLEEACEAELGGDLLDAAKTIRKFFYSKLTTTTTHTSKDPQSFAKFLFATTTTFT